MSELRCFLSALNYICHRSPDVFVSDGSFQGTTSSQPSGWTLVTIVLHGTYSSGGFTVYHNMARAARVTNKRSGSYSSGGGNMVIGRRFVNQGSTSEYSSITVDELMIWDRELTSQERSSLYNLY